MPSNLAQDMATAISRTIMSCLQSHAQPADNSNTRPSQSSSGAANTNVGTASKSATTSSAPSASHASSQRHQVSSHCLYSNVFSIHKAQLFLKLYLDCNVLRSDGLLKPPAKSDA